MRAWFDDVTARLRPSFVIALIPLVGLLASACQGTSYPLPSPTPVDHPAPTTPPTLPAATVPALAVVITGMPSDVKAGSSGTWYASAREAHGTVRFSWTLGDGSGAIATAEGVLRATYGRAGDYRLVVEATDAENRSSSTSTPVHVTVPPAPPPPPPPPAPVPATVLTGSLSCTPKAAGTATPCNMTVNYGGTLPGTSITGMIIDWGDGSATTNTAGTPTPAAASYIYPLSGSYSIFATVTATTIDGVKTATTSKAITIN